MTSASPQNVTITVDEERCVSGLLQVPVKARACYVVAHGAGAGMTHPFLAAIAKGLAERDIATLRYQFPYMEQRTKRPDSPRVAQAAVRAAVTEAARLAPGLPLFAGGKSFGGRMTSQAQAASPLTGVCGLVFLGFPFHPPGRPSEIIGELGAHAALKLVPDADHSFHVPARTGRKDDGVRDELLDALAAWIDEREGSK